MRMSRMITSGIVTSLMTTSGMRMFVMMTSWMTPGTKIPKIYNIYADLRRPNY